MNKIIARIAIVGIVATLGATAASAQPLPRPKLPSLPQTTGPAQAGFTQAAGADFSSHGIEASIFGGTWTNSTPDSGNNVCVGLYEAATGRLDAGCGTLNVTIDPALRTGSITGTIESDLYDANYNDLGPSQIAVDVTFTGGRDLPMPSTFEYAGAYPVGAFASVGTWIGHSATASGSLSSMALCSGVHTACSSGFDSVNSSNAGLGESVELDAFADGQCLPPNC